jgi:UDP-galactopyranose mutase
LPCDGEALIDRCIADCIAVGMIRPDDKIVVRNQVDMPYAYVVYDHARKQNVKLIRDWLETQHVDLAGRYSEWEYYNSDHAFIAGKNAAERVQAALQSEASAEAATLA